MNSSRARIRLVALVVLVTVALVVNGVLPAGAAARRADPPPTGGASVPAVELPPAAQAAISAAVGRDQAAYHLRRVGTDYQAGNPVHGLRTTFGPRGVEVRSGEHTWLLRLAGYGRGPGVEPLPAPRRVVAANRLEYHYPGLVEWYANGPWGLEQGFTLAGPPPGARQSGAPLTLVLAQSGDVRAGVADDRRSLALVKPDGALLWQYTGLAALDADGRALPAWLAQRGGRLLLQVDDASARYPLTVDPFVQSARLAAGDSEAGDAFGYSVAVDGDTVVVGAPWADDLGGYSGAAYVFARDPAGWPAGGMTHTAKLTAGDGEASDEFGYSVAVDGDTVVVGAPYDDDHGRDSGAAYVFVRPPAGWPAGSMAHTAKLTAGDGAADDQFGLSVTVDGDTIVVGAPYDDDLGSASGSAYVFVRPPTGWPVGPWTHTTRLAAGDGGPHGTFGFSVAIDGDTVVIGGPGDDSHTGAVYAFVKGAGGWPAGSLTHTAKLTAGDGEWGDYFGLSVAVDGDTVVGGATGDDGLATDSGAAYVFVKGAGGWPAGSVTHTAKLTAGDGAADDTIGRSVAIDGATVVVGAPYDDGYKGAAYVFVRPPAGWPAAGMTHTAKLAAGDDMQQDTFGYSVAVDGDTVVSGGPGDDLYRGSVSMWTIDPLRSVASGAWSAPGTWEFGLLPTPARNVHVAAGHTVTLDAPGLARGLAISGTLAVDGSQPLLVAGDWTNSGTFQPGLGTVTFAGAPTQTLAGPTATTFYGLAVGGGLVGYWPFDEASGAIAADVSGRGHDGTLTGGPAWTATAAPLAFGRPAALAFDGLDDYVLIPDAPSLSFDDNLAFSLAAWVQTDRTTAQENGAAIIARGTGGGGEQYVLDLETGLFRFFVRDGAGNATGHVWANEVLSSADGWTHVAVVFHAGRGFIALYVDGVEQRRSRPPASLLANSHPVSVGSRQLGTGAYDLNFEGQIDDVRIYDRALAPGEVAALAAGRQANSLLLAAPLDVDGDLALYGAALDVSPAGQPVTAAGDWTHLGGSLLPHAGRVTLDGTALQTVASGVTFHDLAVSGGAVVDVPHNYSLTVDGTLANGGTLRQTQTVAGGAVDYLRITDRAGGVTRYQGLTIDTPHDMGATTVSIGGGQGCGLPDAVRRCYEIVPTTPETATVTFYYLDAEANGNEAPDVYHWTDGRWERRGADARDTAGDPNWVRASGISRYSPFALADRGYAVYLPLLVR